jgi:type IV pilus assembly protein PilE
MMTERGHRRGETRAFTLIEVLVALAVIAVLATLAYPSYQAHIQKSRRTDAKATLHRVALELERCYSRVRSYNDRNTCTLLSAGPRVQLTSDEGWYSIGTQDLGGSETLGRESFILYAVPRRAQAADATCSVFTLTHTGLEQAFDAQSNDTTGVCW